MPTRKAQKKPSKKRRPTAKESESECEVIDIALPDSETSSTSSSDSHSENESISSSTSSIPDRIGGKSSKSKAVGFSTSKKEYQEILKETQLKLSEVQKENKKLKLRVSELQRELAAYKKSSKGSKKVQTTTSNEADDRVSLHGRRFGFMNEWFISPDAFLQEEPAPKA